MLTKKDIADLKRCCKRSVIATRDYGLKGVYDHVQIRYLKGKVEYVVTNGHIMLVIKKDMPDTSEPNGSVFRVPVKLLMPHMAKREYEALNKDVEYPDICQIRETTITGLEKFKLSLYAYEPYEKHAHAFRPEYLYTLAKCIGKTPISFYAKEKSGKFFHVSSEREYYIMSCDEA